MVIPSHGPMPVSKVVLKPLKLVTESLGSHLHLLAWHEIVRSIRAGPLRVGAVTYC